MAALLFVSVNRTRFPGPAVGHAETGRLWQSREFRQHADQVLGAAGTLLHMYDQHQAAAGSKEAEEFPEASVPPPAVLLPVSITTTVEGVTVVW